MKKFRTVALAAFAMTVLFTGCQENYETDTNTVFIKKDGKVISTDVEVFDENTYDKTALEKFVGNAIDVYNGENGADSVVMSQLAVEEGKAKLTLEYATPSDYARFNDSVLFVGTVAEALNAGYAFNMEFGMIENGKAVSCDVNDILGKGDYKVAVCLGSVKVKVPGKIAFVSVPNTTYVDNNTIQIAEGTSLFGQPSAKPEGTEAAPDTESEADTQTPENGADEQSSEDADFDTQIPDDMSDDLIITPEEETEEVFFEFEDEVKEGVNISVNPDRVYTYIIYK